MYENENRKARYIFLPNKKISVIDKQTIFWHSFCCMTNKIKIVDYSNYDKLFKDYQKRKPDFEKFKQEAQKVLDHPEVDEDYKNHVRTLLDGLDKFTNGIEKLWSDIYIQKRKDEIMWNNIEIFNEEFNRLGGFSKDPNLEPPEPIKHL